MQRASDLASLALSIALGGNGEEVGVDLDDGTGKMMLVMNDFDNMKLEA